MEKSRSVVNAFVFLLFFMIPTHRISTTHDSVPFAVQVQCMRWMCRIGSFNVSLPILAPKQKNFAEWLLRIFTLTRHSTVPKIWAFHSVSCRCGCGRCIGWTTAEKWVTFVCVSTVDGMCVMQMDTAFALHLFQSLFLFNFIFNIKYFRMKRIYACKTRPNTNTKKQKTIEGNNCAYMHIFKFDSI